MSATARWTLTNRTLDGAVQTFTDLVFHGGPGSTLEMRLFSRDGSHPRVPARGIFARAHCRGALPALRHPLARAVVGADGRVRVAMKDKHPVTGAVRVLREHGVDFTHHPYEYEERGGTAVSARELGVDEHAVIKTLVMEDDAKRPLIVLMHGDREVSTKNLARQLGVKTIAPCAPVSPTVIRATRSAAPARSARASAMPVYLQRTIRRRCRASTSTAASAAISSASSPTTSSVSFDPSRSTSRPSAFDLHADLAHRRNRAELGHPHLHPRRAELADHDLRHLFREALEQRRRLVLREPLQPLDDLRVVERIGDAPGLERELRRRR